MGEIGLDWTSRRGGRRRRRVLPIEAEPCQPGTDQAQVPEDHVGLRVGQRQERAGRVEGGGGNRARPGPKFEKRPKRRGIADDGAPVLASRDHQSAVATDVERADAAQVKVLGDRHGRQAGKREDCECAVGSRRVGAIAARCGDDPCDPSGQLGLANGRAGLSVVQVELARSSRTTSRDRPPSTYAREVGRALAGSFQAIWPVTTSQTVTAPW